MCLLLPHPVASFTMVKKGKQEREMTKKLRKCEAELSKLDQEAGLKRKEMAQYREYSEVNAEADERLRDRVVVASQELAERNDRVEGLAGSLERVREDAEQPLSLDELWVNSFTEALDDVMRGDDELLQNQNLDLIEGFADKQGVTRCPFVTVQNAMLVQESHNFKIVPGCTFAVLLEEVVRFWGLEPERTDKVSSDVFTLTDEGGSMYLNDAMVLDELMKEQAIPTMFLSPRKRVALNRLKAFQPKFQKLGNRRGGDGSRNRNQGTGNNAMFDVVIKDKSALLRDFFIYALWFLTHVLNLTMRRDVQGAFFIATSLNHTVVNRPFGLYGEKSFSTIDELDEFWEWAEGPLQESMFPRRFYNGSLIGDEQQRKLVGLYGKVAGGVVRFRQLRVEENCGCSLSILGKGVKDTFKRCLGHYTKSCKDTVAFGTHNAQPGGNLTTSSSPSPASTDGAATTVVMSPSPSPADLSPSPEGAAEPLITYNTTTWWQQAYVDFGGYAACDE